MNFMSLRPAWAKLVEGKVGKGRREQKRGERDYIPLLFN